MIILDIHIAFHSSGSFIHNPCEGITHKKTLPFLSIVQAVDGDYEICLNDGETLHTGEGGFFIAPAFARQTIVHHTGKESGTMTARWFFLDVVIDGNTRLDNLFCFPCVIRKNDGVELNRVFDRYFKAQDDFERVCCYYEAVRLIVGYGEKKNEPEDLFMQTIKTFIAAHFSEEIRVKDLARTVSMSESNFYPAFKARFYLSPSIFLSQYRVAVAARLLSGSDQSICRIAEAVGIPDATYFSRLFRLNMGTTPTEYRKLFQKKA